MQKKKDAEMDKKKDERITLNIIGFETYHCELPNDEILDCINLTRDDVLKVGFSFVDMPGYFYREDIAFLGNVVVGGGSLGVGIDTTIGRFELQPFLRYDKGHKSGLRARHFNPKLRIIYPNGKVAYLPPEEKVELEAESAS